jgi:hypothetical protein
LDVKAENVEVENAFAARDYERAAAAQQRLVEELEGKADQPTLMDALGQFVGPPYKLLSQFRMSNTTSAFPSIYRLFQNDKNQWCNDSYVLPTDSFRHL